MRYFEILNEDDKDLTITSLRQLKTMLTYGEIKSPSGKVVIDIDELHEITFPPKFIVNGNLDITGRITAIYGVLFVKGNLELRSKYLSTLPKKLRVDKNLTIIGALVKSLPNNLYVGRNLDISYTKITRLPKRLKVGRNFHLSDYVREIPNDIQIGKNLFLNGIRVENTSAPAKLGSKIR